MDDILTLDKSFNTRVNNDQLKSLAKKEEPRFLSILLKDKDCLMDAIAFGIKPGDEGHFWMPKARFMYMIVYEYYKKYEALLTRTAIESVMDSLSKIGKVTISEDDRTVARMYYDELFSLEAPVEDYEMLKTHINNRYVQWQGFEIMRQAMEGIVKSTNNQDKLIKQIQEKFASIDNMEADSYCGILNMVDAMPSIRNYITSRRDHPEQEPRIPTGINALDKLYFLAPGSYTVIAGMINGGKTTLMFNIGFNMARLGYNVCYVSIEKEAFPFILRLTSLHALVDYNRIKRGGTGDYGLSEVYYNKLMEATVDIERNIQPNFDCIQAVQGTTLTKLITEIEKVKSKKKIDVLIVDYLGVIGFETSHQGRPDLDEAMVSKRLQAYGRINKFVTIAGSQLKTPSVKEIRNKAKKATVEDPSSIEVNTEDLAGSKMIIADADNGWGVVLNHESPPNKMFVYGTKARDDASRQCVALDFDGRIGLLSDPEFHSTHVKEVDSLLYDDNVSEEDLMSDDGLFPSEKIDELNDDDFDFDNDTSKKEDIKTDNKPKSELDEDIFGFVS
jgi:replicative DNA helicase